MAKLFDYLKHETKEQFIVFKLTSQHDIKCFEVLATGSTDSVYMRPAEILRTAMILNFKASLSLQKNIS